MSIAWGQAHASLLPCLKHKQAPTTRALPKRAKVSQTSCPFHSLSPTCPGLPYFDSPPPLSLLLSTSLTETRHLASQETQTIIILKCKNV